MKTKLTLLALLISIVSIAQNQNSINYKAIVKDNNGNVIANQNVTIQFIILQGVAQTNVYQETQIPSTDNNGILIINIGEGTTSDVFADINWSADTHFLNVQIDIGSGLVDLGTTQFMHVPYAIQAERAENVTGLEAINEGNGIGWRLVGKNPDDYGNIGGHAIDLTAQGSNSNRGATGLFSFASGAATLANATYSVAFGEASNSTGSASFSSGRYSTASGNNSTAMGNGTVASGNNSFAIGNGTLASGNNSIAFGQNTRAEAYVSTAIGRYSEGGGNPTDWVASDPLFEIGNGTSNSNRTNALTVRKNGTHIINSQSTGLSINADSYGMLISNPGYDGIVISGATNDGINISAENDGIRISANGDGLVVSADDVGARIFGDNVGVYASGGTFQNDVPDIILGSSTIPQFNDEGIISTNPERLSSDMYLRSYDAVVVQLDYDNNEAGNFRIRNGNDDLVFDVNESGNVDMEGRLQIGTETIEDTGTNELSFNAHLLPDNDGIFRLGNSSNRWLSVWATDGTINTSDRRSKTNITNLNYGLEDVMKLNPVSFNWKTNPNDDTKLGLIAQDLLKVIPEVVKTHDWETDEEGNKIKKELERMGVYYSDLVPVLIKAIQEQQDIIDTQGEEINTLSSELTKTNDTQKLMNNRLKQLEGLLNIAQ